MKSKLKIVSTVDMTEKEWLQYRMNGIGGSEIGTVMMLNPFESRLELFHRKIGKAPLEKQTNERMFWGNMHEGTVAKAWQFYDGSIEGMIGRQKRGKEGIFRKCRKLNAFVVNPDYPFIFSSIDRIINKGQVRVFDGSMLTSEGILECKTIAQWAMKMWEDGIPPSYVVQHQSYLMTTELEYAELATLSDGNSFDVIPFEKNEGVFQSILSHVEPFWERVVKGRNLVQELAVAEEKGERGWINEINAHLQEIEPEADSTEALEKYLKVIHKQTVEGTLQGGLAELEAARGYQDCNQRIKILEEHKTGHSNYLKMVMREHTAIDLGENGKVTWLADKNGSRTLRVKVS